MNPSYFFPERILAKADYREFRDRRFRVDQIILVRVGYFGILIGFCFLILDFFRFENPAVIFATRTGIIGLSLLLVITAKRANTPGQLELLSVLFALLLLLPATAQDINVKDVYPLFYTNFLVAPLFLLFFYPGLKQSTALLVSILILVWYLAYAFRINVENPYHAAQLPNFLFFLLSLCGAGILLRFRAIKDFQGTLAFEHQTLQLDEERRKLKDLNSIKDKLMSVLSHDVKSPLESLRQILHIIRSGYLSEEEKNELFERLEEKVAATSDFVTNTIHWTKSQMDGLSVKKEELNIRDMIFDNLELYRDRLELKNISVVTENIELSTVHADREMTLIAIRNLLNNAIKFSPEGSELEVSTESIDDAVILRFTDRGPGIPEENLRDLFQFKPGDPHHAGGEYSTGIGLVLTQDFMHRNGGIVRAISNAPGPGTTFELSFPKKN